MMAGDGSTCSTCGAHLTPGELVCGSCGAAVGRTEGMPQPTETPAPATPADWTPEATAKYYADHPEAVEEYYRDHPEQRPAPTSDAEATAVEAAAVQPPPPPPPPASPPTPPPPPGGAAGQPGYQGAPTQAPPSGANYLWVLLGWIGGLIGYFTLKDRDPRMAKRILWIGIALSVVGFIFAIIVWLLTTAFIFGAARDLETAFPSITATSEPTPSATPSGTASVPAGRNVTPLIDASQYTWAYTQPSGAKTSIKFSVGTPVPVSESPYLDDIDGTYLVAAQVCPVGPKDAVVPFEESLENTGTISAYVAANNAASVPLEAALAGGVKCKPAGEALTLQSSTMSAPQETVGVRGFLVIKDYYATPAGNPALINNVKVTVNPAEDGVGGTWTLAAPGVQGAGAVPNSGGAGIANQFNLVAK